MNTATAPADEQLEPTCPECGSYSIRVTYDFVVADIRTVSADGDWDECDGQRDSEVAGFHCADCRFETDNVMDFVPLEVPDVYDVLELIGDALWERSDGFAMLGPSGPSYTTNTDGYSLIQHPVSGSDDDGNYTTVGEVQIEVDNTDGTVRITWTWDDDEFSRYEVGTTDIA